MHNLDTTAGQTSFVSAREDAWHSLGTTLDHSFTAEEAMREALLGGWNVRKHPLLTLDDDGKAIPVPGMNAVVRTNPVNGGVDVLTRYGVSDSYTIIQNESHADLLNALVDESGAHFETAGALDGGRKVFITMKLPGYLQVGGTDRVDNYLAAVNSHDGCGAFTMLVTPVRVVCQNTMNLALSGAKQQFRMRHTASARFVAQQAREVLDLTYKYLDTFAEDAEKLIQTSLTQREFEKIIHREFGPAEGAPAATVTRKENVLEEMGTLFADALTQEGIRGSAWAGLNALTEWADHYSPTRGGREGDRDTTRMVNAVLAPGFKNRAYNLMMGLV